MAINQINTSNTFQHWLTTTQSLIAFANSITDAPSSTFTANVSEFITTGDLTVGGDLNVTSDMALKDNIIKISNSLDVLEKITGIEFNWKDDGVKSYGVSAQEIEEVLPEIVRTRNDGYKGVNYLNLIAFLIEAIKDLKGDISKIKNHINID